MELKQSFFLFGPRGTGKTTWLRASLDPAKTIYIDLLAGDLYAELLARPQRLESLLIGKPEWVVLDEIQRVPALLNEVHRLIESKGLRFAMTGSSARSLRRKGVNLLAGRALTFHMHPLVAEEMGGEFRLDHALQFGLLPSVPGNPAPRDYLKSYVLTYLREEVLQEGLIRNLGNFARFLETASFSQGSVLNMAEVSRESGLDRKVVDHYFGILEDLMIGIRLPIFNRRAKRRLVAHPKFYFFDAGVFRSLRPLGPLDSPAEAEGACLETLVLQHLRAVNDALGLDYTLSYWRTSDGTEVDFILYGPRGMLALEVKRAERISRGDLTGLRSFKADFPEARCLLLYGGDRPRQEEGIHVLPVRIGLEQLSRLLSNPQEM